MKSCVSFCQKNMEYELNVGSNEYVAAESLLIFHDKKLKNITKRHGYKYIIWSHITFNLKVPISSEHGWFCEQNRVKLSKI